MSRAAIVRSEIGKVGLGHLVIEGFVGDRGVQTTALKPRWKSARVSTRWLAQVAVSAKPKRNGVMIALAPTKLRGFATGVEQRFGKHPLELVSDHAKLSVIHLGLLSLYPKQHTQEEFRMDHNKNPQ